ncbi:von Willebrand factor A domain-containing protein 8 [Rhizophagus clarus]|uniref:von Willebrand factor A domain-containing protein 8 n=1 Tax=Rhizophagus clarus TaxID=94130 RepID=A0A8H3R201_9GLOM|nr:von Willebrand factor A domain-containing protein 8 [Rhizophagus clarus]
MSPNNKKSQKNITDTNESTKRRILHHTKIIESKEQHNNDYDSATTLHGFHTSHDKEKAISTIRIGDVSLRVTKSKCPELVPHYIDPLFEESQEVLRHLRWMMQKDKLGQDIFLIGPPGNLRRGLVLKYAQLTNREIEYIPLSKDCTDSDLKQRREISAGTAYYVDQACVRAAINGRILILDGIEKAERNVLPILNNLLENREMSLEDGRFLVHPKRYDSLVKTNEKSVMDKWKLVRVSDRFIVMALGLPVPPYVGHPLDPPLRSRFQSRDIKPPGFDSQIKHLKKLVPNADSELVERLVSVATVLGSMSFDEGGGIEIPEFPISVDTSVFVLQNFPYIKPRFLLDLLYPWPLLPTCTSEQRSVIEATYHRFGMLGFEIVKKSTKISSETEEDILFQCMPGYNITHIKLLESKENTILDDSPIHKIDLKFHPKIENGKDHLVQVFGGGEDPSTADFFVETDYHRNMFNSMLIAHSVGDFCVLGGKGVGKSALIRHFAINLGYTIEYIPLYKDMSARDLLQRRSTTFAGDTVWENSSLVKAALSGSLAVMDGIDTLSFGTIVTLQRLVKEREISLPDGTQLIHPTRYQKLRQDHGLTKKQLDEKKIFYIHPAFRIVALGRPFSGGNEMGRPGSWLSPEIVSMFQFIVVRPLDYQEEMQVLETLSPGIDTNNLSLLLRFANRLRRDSDETVKTLSNSLSTRQLIRICRRLALFPNDSLYEAIHRVSLSRFLPSLAKMALEELMADNGILPSKKIVDVEQLNIEVLPSRSNPQILKIGNVEEPITKDSNPLLIPDVVFHENPKQTEILMQMLQDYQLGEHLLLIGNQGVGKNKLADYFLQLLRLPREYIQLHRDTTVQSLTSTPSIVDGVLQFEDSPLVKAVKNGYILVVDEADKAPTYVTAVLRNLLEDGQMVLGDGRRIVSSISSRNNKEGCIVIHRNFRMIVLANRPGFPFLGNDFYREIGDVFSCHAVDNPDSESEIFLLRKYAPDISEDLLLKLTSAFGDLRKLVDEGLISYPYSTRELVNIVKHMQQYPDEGISRILQNVFDFDQYDKDSKDLLIEAFQKHGIPVGLESDFSIKLGKRIPLSEPIITEIWTHSNSESKFCGVKQEPIIFSGGWEIQVSKPKELDRTEGRIVTFTEQIYSFKIPTRGEALDIAALPDGSLFVVTTNPVTLHAIDQNHQRVRSIDMYEFFPLQKASPRLRIAIVQTQETWYLMLHNPTENSLLSVDFARNSAVSITLFASKITLAGLSPVKSIMLRDYESLGILVFYQVERSIALVLDFNSNTQHIIEVPIKISHLHLIRPDVWIMRDCSNGNYHLIYNDDQSIAPNLIKNINVKGLFKSKPEVITYLSQDSVPYPNVSSARFLHNENDSNALSIISNIPEKLMNNPQNDSKAEIISYLRESGDDGRNYYKNFTNASLFLKKSGQLATIIPLKDGRSEGYLELFNPVQNTLWRVTMPLSIPDIGLIKKDPTLNAIGSPYIFFERIAAAMLELPNGDLLTMDISGVVRIWQVDAGQLIKAAKTWRKLVGSIDQRTLSIIYEDFEGNTISEQIGNNEDVNLQEGGSGSGEGNGYGSGGSGGDGAGSGAGGGGGDQLNLEGREPTFIDVSNMEIRTEAKPPLELTDAQRELHEISMQKRQEQINMTQADLELFRSYLANVQREIRELRVILESIEAKNKERVWLKNQSSGDVDDTKLIEGLTGDRNIYKRRGENDPEIGFFQQRPKKMYFLFDLSASMYRFNSYDRRLERSMEVALMIMESFKSFEHKFQYKIIGHSGDGPNIELVKEGKYPHTEKESLKIINQMLNHSQFCLSGDNTVSATAYAITDIVKEEADDYFVVVLSDANIQQYNINPADIAKALNADEKVTSSIIFIGSLADQAEKLKKYIGNKAHICMDNKDLPKIMKSIFLASMLKD